MRLTTEKEKTVYVPNDPDGAFITIRALSKEKIAKIESKSSTTSLRDTGDAQLEIDTYRRTNGIVIACLKDWGKFFDEKGKEMKFTRQNVMLAANLSVIIEKDEDPVRLYEWIEKEHDNFLEEVEKETKEAQGN